MGTRQEREQELAEKRQSIHTARHHCLEISYASLFIRFDFYGTHAAATILFITILNLLLWEVC